MKKILSTFVMCVILGVGSVCAQTYEATLNVTINAAYRSTPTATDGEIISQVCTYEEVNGDLQKNCASSKSGITYVVSMDKPANNGLLAGDKKNAYKQQTQMLTGSIHLSSNYLGENNKYVFSHWEVTDNLTGVEVTFNASNSESQCSYSIEVQQQVLFNISSDYKWLSAAYAYTVSSKGTVAANITFTAVWVQPQVTGVDADYTLEKITDPSETRTQNIKFTLKDAIAKNNFKCIPEGDGFSLNATDWSVQYPTSYTATALYTPTGIHGTHTGSITLHSNHPSTDATSAKSTLKVEEDYTPEFVVPATYVVSTQVQPTYVGAYTQLTETDIVPTNLNYAARTMLMDGAELKNGCVWNVNLRENTSGFFSLEESGETQVVRFTPTGTVNATTPYTATLDITCTYYDAIGKDIVVTKSIVLSAYAKNDDNARLEIESGSTYDMHFDVIYGTPQKKSASYVAINLSEEPTEVWTSSTNQITYVNNGSLITVSVSNTIALGGHTAKLSYTSGEKNIELNVSADVQLATPVLSAYGGLSQVTLVWTPVYGADEYVIESGGMIIAKIPAPADSYVIENMTNGTSVTYTVTAVYLDDQQYNKISNEATATPNLPSTITAGDIPFLGIYTGTEKTGTRPYYKNGKRLVDLSAAFKDGKALFDQLFIFGLTTGVDGSVTINPPTATTNSDAVTPCYIYKKSESGDNYILSKTIDNVNVATKPEEFNIKASGQKVYMTGYAPYASCGSTWNENAVFYFIGDGEDVEVYLDNLQLYARPKAVNGNKAGTNSYTITNVNEALDVASLPEFEIVWDGWIPQKVNVYAQGSGSAFSFQAKSNNFSPKIHLNGENVLESAEGMYIFVNVNMGIEFKTDVPVVQKSAPIQILHDKTTAQQKNRTVLSIDDKWGNERTNGALDLADGVTVRNAPTIDLGNENTELHIDGGQITLSNSFPSSGDGKYTVSFAISYRKYSIKNGLANMYGLGSDQPEGKVRFNDGTINCKPLKDEYFKNNENARELYHNLTSMKCPLDTKIDGGTFNVDVLACGTTTSKGSSPKNTKGDPLCMITLPIESINTFNGTAILRDDWMDMALANGANTNQLSYYGIASMEPEITTDEGGTPIRVVNLMLPSDQICFVDVQTTPWVMCYPQLNISALGKTEELGGEVPVPFSRSVDGEGLTTIKKTSKLFYGEIDPLYMISSIDSYDAPGDMTVGLRNDGLPETVTNGEDYVVYDKIYMMLPVVADQWRMFVPPFNVSNVYVIESYPETKLIEDFGSETTDKKGNVIKKIIEADKIKSARITQAHRTLDLFYHWVFDVDVNKSTSDFWSNDKKYRPIGTYNSYGGFVKNWMDMYDTSYRPIIDQLYHYTSDPSAEYPEGKFWWDANFYLYKATSNVVAFEDNKLQMDWEEVPIVSKARNLAGNHNVIMERGGIYVWSFPSTIENSEMQDYTKKWDYWTGKYILLEGYPTEDFDTDGDGKNDDKGQLIAGANALNSNVLVNYETTDPAFSNTAEMRGNYTFAKGSLDAVQNPFVLNNYYRGTSLDPDQTETLGWSGLLDPESAHNVYVNADGFSVDLTPGQGFILPNFTSTYNQRPRSINVKTGVVTYFDDDNTTTSIPTIAGNNQMFVYNIAGGVGIVPVVAQQVSIYNAAGQLVTSEYLTDEVHISLPTGIYLIAGAQDQFKAVVK